MKKFILAMGLAALAFVGCGDDESWSSPVKSNGDSGAGSSSVERGSSSSEKAKSSSSDTQSEAGQFRSSESRSDSSSVETICSPEEEGSAKMGIKGEILLCMDGNWVSSGVFD